MNVVWFVAGALVWPAIYLGSWGIAWIRYRHRTKGPGDS